MWLKTYDVFVSKAVYVPGLHSGCTPIHTNIPPQKLIHGGVLRLWGWASRVLCIRGETLRPHTGRASSDVFEMHLGRNRRAS